MVSQQKGNKVRREKLNLRKLILNPNLLLPNKKFNFLTESFR